MSIWLFYSDFQCRNTKVMFERDQKLLTREQMFNIPVNKQKSALCTCLREGKPHVTEKFN